MRQGGVGLSSFSGPDSRASLQGLSLEIEFFVNCLDLTNARHNINILNMREKTTKGVIPPVMMVSNHHWRSKEPHIVIAQEQLLFDLWLL